MRRRVLTLAIVASSLALLPAAAHAATSPTDLAGALPVASIFSKIGDALLGGLNFGVGFFKDLFLAIFGGLADLLIPDGWAKKGTELLTWLVAAPDLSKSAFSDLHTLSHISTWIGLAMLPVTLTATLGGPSIGLSGNHDNPGEVIGRTLGAAVAIVLWTTIWQQGAALSNTISAAFIRDPIAVAGMNAYMELIAVGGMVGGTPFLGVLIILFASAVFLAALVLKVFLLITQAVLFIGVPLLLGVIATRWGARMARVAATAMITTWIVPILWGLIMVASGVLIHRAPAIGAAIGGKGGIASTGGMLVAGCAAIAGPLLCTALAKSALGPLGHQLSAIGSAISPGRVTARVGNGASALSRAGAVGGAPRAVSATAGTAGTPAGAMARLMQARLGGVQAARMGAASARPSAPGVNPHPLGSPARAAGTVMRGGALAVAGVQAGRLVGHAQTQLASVGGVAGAARSTQGRWQQAGAAAAANSRPTSPVGTPGTTPTRTHQADSAAVQNMRPTGRRAPNDPSLVTPGPRATPNGTPSRGPDSTQARYPGTTPIAASPNDRRTGAGAGKEARGSSSSPSVTPTRRVESTTATTTRKTQTTATAATRTEGKKAKEPTSPRPPRGERPGGRTRPTNEPGLES